MCSAQYVSFLYFLDFSRWRYVAQVFSEWLWDGYSCPFVFTFHMRCISIVRPLYFRMFSVSSFITFLSSKIATSINVRARFSLSRIMMSGLLLGMVLSVCTYWFHNMVTSCFYWFWYMLIIIIIIIIITRTLNSVLWWNAKLCSRQRPPTYSQFSPQRMSLRPLFFLVSINIKNKWCNWFKRHLWCTAANNFIKKWRGEKDFWYKERGKPMWIGGRRGEYASAQ